MKVTATTVLVYGLIVLVGGFMGHYQSGSQASLISGIVFGVLLLGCAYAIAKGKVMAQYIALILTFALDGFFTYRFAKTLKFIPAGLMSVLSLVVLIVIALKIRKTMKFRK